MDDGAQADLDRALREARPAHMRDGFGVRGPQPTVPPIESANVNRRSDSPTGSVVRSPRAVAQTESDNSFTPATSTVVAVSFLLQNASEDDNNKVLIFDGKIDGEFPTGMGANNYVIDTPGARIIYAAATFNPTTLLITSRTVEAAATLPESRVESDSAGFLYWQLGFTSIDNDVFTVWNTHLGDIYLELIYGAFNGQPALWAGDKIGWLDLALL